MTKRLSEFNRKCIGIAKKKDKQKRSAIKNTHRNHFLIRKGTNSLPSAINCPSSSVTLSQMLLLDIGFACAATKNYLAKSEDSAYRD